MQQRPFSILFETDKHIDYFNRNYRAAGSQA